MLFAMTKAEMLWFDVGIKRYTTIRLNACTGTVLWFDVGIKRYTTRVLRQVARAGCGLM